MSLSKISGQSLSFWSEERPIFVGECLKGFQLVVMLPYFGSSGYLQWFWSTDMSITEIRFVEMLHADVSNMV